jgi:nitrate reductase cytochrome c-type subunit
MKTTRTEGSYVTIEGRVYQEMIGHRDGVEVERYLVSRSEHSVMQFNSMEAALAWLADREAQPVCPHLDYSINVVDGTVRCMACHEAVPPVDGVPQWEGKGV